MEPGFVICDANVWQGSLVHQALNVVRTLDGSHFKPVVALQTVAKDECPQLHLVAVTSAGVRLYFTTLPWAALAPAHTGLSTVSSLLMPHGPETDILSLQTQVSSGLPQPQPWQHAHSLSLVHVRLPPGYSAQAHTQPHNVHKVLCRRGGWQLLHLF